MLGSNDAHNNGASDVADDPIARVGLWQPVSLKSRKPVTVIAPLDAWVNSLVMASWGSWFDGWLLPQAARPSAATVEIRMVRTVFMEPPVVRR